MTSSLWVFGYGSLLWNPGFQFSSSEQGILKGFSRRFYQGNVTHRGQPGKPGRVATLIEDTNSEVWGVAYEVVSPSALPYLDKREVQLGGYTTSFVEFQPSSGGQPFPVLVYMATKDSSHWLGHAPEADIAEQILASSGPSGHNVEYLLRLAEFQRSQAPGLDDPHLYKLEHLVRERIYTRGLPLLELMGPNPETPSPTGVTREDEEVLTHQQFAPNLPNKKLRCLSI